MGFSVSLNEDSFLGVLWVTEPLCACTVQIRLEDYFVFSVNGGGNGPVCAFQQRVFSL